MKTSSYLFFLVMMIVACSTNDNSKIPDIHQIGLNNSYKDSFKAMVTRFEFDRHKVLDDPIGEFLVEEEFTKKLTSDFRKIDWYQGKVLFDKYDTIKMRREMMLVDDNTLFFHAIVRDSSTKNISPFSIIKFKGTMLGFKLTPGKDNSDLISPNFIVLIDSIRL
jgi:hypothetical protein